MGQKDYGRNQKKRKEYIHQSGLLLAGVDVSKVKHDVCIGTLEGIRSSGFRDVLSTCKLMFLRPHVFTRLLSGNFEFYEFI